MKSKRIELNGKNITKGVFGMIIFLLIGFGVSQLLNLDSTKVCPANNNSFFTADVARTYIVNVAGVFETIGKGNFEFNVIKNYDKSLTTGCNHKLNVQTDVKDHSMNMNCIIHLDIGDTIGIILEAENTTNDVLMKAQSISLVRIGD